MNWQRQPESDLAECREGTATYVQTWDGVQVVVGDKVAFVPMREYSEERLRQVAAKLADSATLLVK